MGLIVFVNLLVIALIVRVVILISWAFGRMANFSGFRLLFVKLTSLNLLCFVLILFIKKIALTLFVLFFTLTTFYQLDFSKQILNLLNVLTITVSSKFVTSFTLKIICFSLILNLQKNKNNK